MPSALRSLSRTPPYCPLLSVPPIIPHRPVTGQWPVALCETHDQTFSKALLSMPHICPTNAHTTLLVEEKAVHALTEGSQELFLQTLACRVLWQLEEVEASVGGGEVLVRVLAHLAHNSKLRI